MKLYKNCSELTVKLIEYIKENPHTVDHMNEFLHRYQDVVFNFIRLSVGNYHDSLELTNKVLLTLSVKVKEIQHPQAFNYLAIKIIKGEIGNFWRTQKSKKRAIVQNKSEHEVFAEQVFVNDQRASEVFESLLIREIIEEMPDPYIKDIFLLKYRDNQNASCIAKDLGISRYQVNKSLQILHNELKKCIGEQS
ncbi:sigma-70 family RNA polymerase sigma factor [Candidatus Uabimicrobium sp. HlEnr_7]|uniref:sigma-70 family RNA polymerase sigma factor n=1 Tax=Candidatus Uabimicrobium helgolandensis TaxID=3095367 RepID=UPI0035574511